MAHVCGHVCVRVNVCGHACVCMRVCGHVSMYMCVDLCACVCVYTGCWSSETRLSAQQTKAATLRVLGKPLFRLRHWTH